MPEPRDDLQVSDSEILAMRDISSALEGTKNIKQIGDSVSKDTIFLALTGSCKRLFNSQREISMLKFKVGKLLLMVQGHPDIYTSRGYGNFNDFMGGLKEMIGLPRSEAYGAKALAEKWPSMKPETVEEIGYGSLREISKYTREGDTKADRYIELARENKLDDLKNVLATLEGVSRDEIDMTSIHILCTKDIAKRWLSFSSKPEIISVNRSESHGVILDNMMSECEAEWISRGSSIAVEGQILEFGV